MTQKPSKVTDDNTSTQGETQQIKKSKPKSNVSTIPNRGTLDYDIDQIDKFIDTVFHTDLLPDEHIIGWSSNSSIPGLPKDIDAIVDKLSRTGLAKACYFGTSTVLTHADGNLYNRKSQFSRLHVVVLDDIGTKVNAADLPPDLVPNYIIESSEGNFQYGFILNQPIDDLELADALIHLVYTSGYGDEGGKMPTKVVRMPCGINGKKGDKGDFKVRLVELNTDYWTPDELLDVLDVGVSWSDVVKDVNVAKQGRTSQFTGTSMWSPIKPTAASLDGVIDPVLEWLYEQDLVKHDTGEWVTIQCPWHEGHTSGEDTAGYSPVGRGGEFSKSRGFKCFHDHCSDKTAHDFLEYVAMEAGIFVPVIDNVADLVADYAYVAAEDAAYRIRGVNKPVGMALKAFKNLHTKKVMCFDHQGKQKPVAESALWLSAPNRVAVQGLISDPSSKERIVEHDNLRYLNTFAYPHWGKGQFDVQDVNKFVDFLTYLIPNDAEREYFIQWLAAKAQDLTFRGATVLMVAPTQGTGRTTLTDMMATLFTQNNVKKVTFDQLAAAGESGKFNDFLEANFVTCDEVMSHNQNAHKVYESLKDMFDPRPKQMVINQKYGTQRYTVLYTSFLLLTNHSAAIGALGGDRRIYVIQNTKTPNSPEYFTELNAWLDVKDDNGEPVWARNVWRWLQTVETDLTMLNAPAPDTSAKTSMIELTKSIVDLAADAISNYFGGVIPASQVQVIAKELLDYREEDNIDRKAHAVDKLCKQYSNATEERGYMSSKRTRLRLTYKLEKEMVDMPPAEQAAHIKELFEKAKDKYEKDPVAAIKEMSDEIDSAMV